MYHVHTLEMLLQTKTTMLPTPQIGHLTSDDYEHVYEPAEDSFIFLDALEEDADDLRQLQPDVCVEIGPGSGIVSVFLRGILKDVSSFFLAVDINPKACDASLRTATANGTFLDTVNGSLLAPLIKRLAGEVDILLFNPPYVPTEEEELWNTQQIGDIGSTWAGGADGMRVTDIVLNMLPLILSPKGRFYLVAVEQNKPLEIIARMKALGLNGSIVIKRRAGREMLYVLKIIRP